jgi:uncharacterized SAM-binding protein YcdF (DUF218 family)
MFFTLSKLLYFFITPFCWILFPLLGALFLPKKRKVFLVLTLILVLIFTNPWLYRKMMMLYQENSATVSDSEFPTTAILLTGIVGFDSSGNGHFGRSSDRYIQTSQLLQTGKIQRLIISGGSGNFWRKENTESLFIKNQLKLTGIPDSCLLAETRSRNTYENAVYTKKLIDSLHLKGPFLLITSALHMPRARKVFTALGIPYIPFPCDFRVYPQANDFKNTFYPDVAYMGEWEDLIKEWVGTIIYRLTGKA